VLANGIAVGLGATATELPKSIQKMLQDKQLSSDILSGLDDELRVPQEWLDGAKREGTVRILGSWDAKEFQEMTGPFAERYPYIKMQYTEGRSTNARAVVPLIAMKEGRYVTEIVTGIAGNTYDYQQAHALEDLRDLPGFKNLVKGASDPQGTWVGSRLRYWCMAYNTTKVKKEDLPKTWDDILTNPIWRNGNIGAADRPQLWLLMLWGQNGRDWTVDYINKFFNIVKPQLRKEGANALLSLTSVGEFNATVPAADYATKQYIGKGAPLAWHCPEPVPLAVSQTGILKGSPNINSARVWMNWFLSKEGQIAQFAVDGSPPVHKDLQVSSFLPFADEIQGKKVAFRDPSLMDKQTNDLMNVWTPIWSQAR
jgi:iron(III) transport system substrate-binding protein